MSLFPGPHPPMEDLVPHRAPMLLLDAVREFERTRLLCDVEIRDDHLFLRDGALEPCALMEMIAQGAAALLGYRGRLEGEGVYHGYLVGVQKMRFGATPVPVGSQLAVEVVEERGRGEFGWYRGAVTLGDDEVCTGTLIVVRDRETPVG